eukprot:Sspe_Gene.67579::Locus_39871_Transcript_1_1_Confidence_1.000_Length_1534::g.67579::m.67579
MESGWTSSSAPFPSRSRSTNHRLQLPQGMGQQQQKTEKKIDILREILKNLAQDLHSWGGGRPGRGDHIRMRQVLQRRLKLERTVAVETSLSSDILQNADNPAAKFKQIRAHRQRFITRLRAIANDNHHEAGRNDLKDSEVILHCFAALLDSHHFGQSAHTKSNFTVE